MAVDTTTPIQSPSAVVAGSPTESAGRLISLDAYRGLIMFTLLLGGVFHSLKGHPVWNWLYLQNEHVEWRGCVYWDLIQPSFMFMVGVAMPFAFAKRLAQGQTQAQVMRHVLIRALGLIILGIILDHHGQTKIQIGFIRVLQQIAFGYVISAFFVGKPFKTQAIGAAAILIGYQLLWMFNPSNGPRGPWAAGNQNIGSALDWWLLHRYYGGYYVGLNAIPSAATILFGVMAGQLISMRLPHPQTVKILLTWGTAGIVVGLAVNPWFPLIKRIWTPSFAIFAAGCTTLILLAFFWIIEVKGSRRWAFPLVIVGMNSTAAYVLGNAFGGWFERLSSAWVIWLQPLTGIYFPVIQRCLFAAFAWCVLYWLYRRRIFFKL